MTQGKKLRNCTINANDFDKDETEMVKPKEAEPSLTARRRETLAKGRKVYPKSKRSKKKIMKIAKSNKKIQKSIKKLNAIEEWWNRKNRARSLNEILQCF